MRINRDDDEHSEDMGEDMGTGDDDDDNADRDEE